MIEEQFHLTRIELWFQYAPWYHGVEAVLMAWDERIRPTQAKVARIEWIDRGEPGTIISPTFKLEMTEAQSAMDRLWQCGIRPTEGRGSAGSLEATEGHLKDMRAIVFDKLKVEQPK